MELSHFPAQVTTELSHFSAQISTELNHFSAQPGTELSHFSAHPGTELSHFPAESGVEIGHIALGGNLIPERVVERLSGGFGGFLRKPALIAEFARQFQSIDDRHGLAVTYHAQDAS